MAFGTDTTGGLSAGVSDIFAAFGDIDKMKADELEGAQYSDAAQLAFQNEQFTKQSTQIKEAQTNRELTQAQGRTTADIAGAGFASSGSALDILASNAQQGAITKAVASEQGLVTEAGYQEQGESYQTMAKVAADAAKGANLASIGSFVAAGLSFVGAGASLAGAPSTPLAPTTSSDPTQIGALY
jgi:hypothetical protein